MLAAAELRQSIRRTAVMAGAVSRPLALDGDREAYAAAVVRRNVVAEHQDDSGAVERLQAKGVRVIKARGRIEEPGVLTAGGLRIGWRDLVIATGARFREIRASPVSAPCPSGTASTSTRVTSCRRRRSSSAAGPSGARSLRCSLRFGCHVTLVQHSPQLLSREEPAVAAALAAALRADGVDVRLSVNVRQRRACSRRCARHPRRRAVGDGRPSDRRHRQASQHGRHRARAAGRRAGRARLPAGRRSLPGDGTAQPLGGGRRHRRRPVHPHRQLSREDDRRESAGTGHPRRSAGPSRAVSTRTRRWPRWA